MATRVGRSKIWRTSFDSPIPKTPCERKNPNDISYTSRVIVDFVLNFVAMATRVGRCKIWLTSFDSPYTRTPGGRKNRNDISYTSRVIVDFVPHFVVMATRVGRCKIWLASFDSPIPKTPQWTQKSQRYLLHKPSYSRFFPKFRCHGNQGRSL